MIGVESGENRSHDPDTAAESLLRVDDLRVAYRTPRGIVEAVRGVSFELDREKLGIVGNPAPVIPRPVARSSS